MQINFVMICIIHKISVLLKITRILKTPFKDFYLKIIIIFFLQHITIDSPRFEADNVIKDVKIIFRLEKLNKETIKDIGNLFKLKKFSS